MAKSWQEKLQNNHPVKIETLEKKFAGLPAGSSLLIVNPPVVKKFIDKIPPGKRMGLPEIRQKLARKYRADAMCPLTSGIFLRIVSEAAWDEILAGKSPGEVTPFWRAISPKDAIIPKLRCGREFLEKMWSAEGNEREASTTAGNEHLGRIRRICNALPGTTEKLSHGAPTFFLNTGVYLMFADNHHSDGLSAVWIPAAPGEQEALIRTNAKTYFRPPYLGVKGWVGIQLDQVSDDELGGHIHEAWKIISSKKKSR
jgi:hypothetical protein